MKKIIFIIFLLLTGCVNKNMPALVLKFENQKNIRPALAAGQFYPADVNELKNKIIKYLDDVPISSSTINAGAIMAPHAGYDFSGLVAAHAYKQLEEKNFGTVIIMCNSHAVYFDGIAVDSHDAWQTPLGEVAVDKELAQKLIINDSIIQYNDKPFIAADQTIEVQIPFLQMVLKPGFKILPIYFGNTGEDDYKKLAKVLADNLSDNDLIVASSDMSHYPDYDDANRIDNKTLEIIKSANTENLEKYITEIISSRILGEETLLCGEDGVKTVMELYKLKGWSKIEILHYANSGGVTIGSKDSVVGYGAVAFIKNNSEAGDNKNLSAQQKQKLLEIAKTTVESYVKNKTIPEFKIEDERLNWHEGAFATIHKNGELRGCIGQIIPSNGPLWQVVRDMAIAACSEDNRFLPISVDELDKLDYEISVLSAPEQIDDWQKIELGKHGVIVKSGWHSGVFLPQVAMETGWSREEFLSQLCTQKAGLPADCYKDKNVELLVFTALMFGDKI